MSRPDRDNPRILDVAEWLHMMATGSAEGMIEESDGMARWLRTRIQNWKPTVLAKCAVYDSIIRTLALQALDEYDLFRALHR